MVCQVASQGVEAEAQVWSLLPSAWGPVQGSGVVFVSEQEKGREGIYLLCKIHSG